MNLVCRVLLPLFLTSLVGAQCITAELLVPNLPPCATTGFGETVAIDGDTAVVGAWLAAEGPGSTCGLSGSGRVFVFRRNPNTSTWTLTDEIGNPIGGDAGRFGRTLNVALSGPLVVVSDTCNSSPTPALPRLRESLRQTKRTDDVWVALRALAALGHAGGGAGAEVEPWLSHPEAFVRTQAARTVAAIDHRAGVAALIARLEDDDARWRQTVADALTQLTGQTFGSRSTSWQAWWQAEGETFVREGRPKTPPKQAPARRQPPSDAAATRSGTYFGIPQDGRAVLYLVDFSQSMQAKTEGDGATTRWQACLRELGRAIDQLTPGQTFNVVVFAQRVLAWSERQMPADARNAAAAKTWLAELELELGTAVFEAFEVAFALGGVALEDRAYAAQIDTIFFLSDGLPTVRQPKTPRKLEPDDPALVRAMVRRHNPVGAVVVHTILLGRAGGGPFLRDLAADNGGRFVKR